MSLALAKLGVIFDAMPQENNHYKCAFSVMEQNHPGNIFRLKEYICTILR
jgi:hypothetical protein